MGCGGSLPKEGCLVLNPSTGSWILMWLMVPIEKCLED